MQKLDQSQFSFISESKTININKNKIKVTHKCIGGNELSCFCVNKCQKNNLFFCKDEDCECYENHQLCSKNGIKTILKKITQKYTLELDKMTLLKTQISEIFTQIIDKISEYQETIKKTIQNDLKIIQLTDLEKNFYELFVEEKTQNFKEFNGEKLNNLIQMNHENKQKTKNQKLTEQNRVSLKNYQKMFEQGTQTIKIYFSQILDLIKQKSILGNNKQFSKTKDINQPISVKLTKNKNEQLIKKILQKKPNKTKLCFRDHIIGTQGMKILADQYKNWYKIKRILLQQNNIGAEGMKYLSNATKDCFILTQLFLRNNNIGAEGMKYLSNSLKNWSQLKSLSLQGNNIGIQGMKHLADTSKSLSRLEQFNLNENNIRAQGIKYFADVSKNFSQLMRFSIRYNNIGAEGLKYLVQASQNLLQLTKLDLRNNNIKNQQMKLVEIIHKNIKDIKIHI